MVKRHLAWHASLPLDSKHGQRTSGGACHHSPWTAHTTRQRQEWHAIVSIGVHTRIDYVRCAMLSSLLDNTSGRTKLGLDFGHYALRIHMTRRRLAWHAIITLGQQKQLEDFKRGWSWSLQCTHRLTMLGLAFQFRLLKAYTNKYCQAWHAIIAFGLLTR